MLRQGSMICGRCRAIFPSSGAFCPSDTEGSGRYPPLAQIRSIAECDLKLSAHLCGGYARSIVQGESLPATVVSLLDRFSRIQINTAARGVEPTQIARFAVRFGARGILQCRGFEHFPDNTDVDWLSDRSGGKGLCQAVAGAGPAVPPSATPAGWAETVADALNAITGQHPEPVPFWIEMEGAIRTDDIFDVSKCRRVCEIVYG